MSKFLKDIQNLEDKRGIDIQKVGINNVDVPLLVQKKDAKDQIVSAKAKMSVDLPAKYKGTHMSRFIKVLNTWSQKGIAGIDIKGCLEDLTQTLNAKNASVKFNFKYYLEKTAPVTCQKGMMAYDCSFEGGMADDVYTFILGVKVPVTTLCPCSKEISEYSAHNQRALISVKIQYDEDNHIWLEDLIEALEKCGSCPVYPFLKREDEKYVTEFAYNNPKFVEDVLRDTIIVLRNFKVIKKAKVEVEAMESIHNHNAWAFQEICFEK